MGSRIHRSIINYVVFGVLSLSVTYSSRATASIGALRQSISAIADVSAAAFAYVANTGAGNASAYSINPSTGNRFAD